MQKEEKKKRKTRRNSSAHVTNKLKKIKPKLRESLHSPPRNYPANTQHQDIYEIPTYVRTIKNRIHNNDNKKDIRVRKKSAPNKWEVKGCTRSKIVVKNKKNNLKQKIPGKTKCAGCQARRGKT